MKRVRYVEAERPASQTKGLTLGRLLNLWSAQCAPLGSTDLHPLFDAGQEAASSVAEHHFHLMQPLSAQRASGANGRDGHSHGPGSLKKILLQHQWARLPLRPGPEHPAEWDLGVGIGGSLPESSVSGRVPERQAPEGRLWWA